MKNGQNNSIKRKEGPANISNGNHLNAIKDHKDINNLQSSKEKIILKQNTNPLAQSTKESFKKKLNNEFNSTKKTFTKSNYTHF